MKGQGLALLLVTVFLAAACSPWSPERDTRVYKSSYKLTTDGKYRVRKGDTLHAIAFNFSTDWRDIAAWNNIRSPYTIYPDQELRLSAPPRSSNRTAKSSTRPASTASTSKSTKQNTAKAPAKPPPAKPAAASGPSRWLWPSEGRLISTFKANDPARNGIEIGGKEGQAVRATAAGEVVYSGNGLIGYGEMIIIKHSETMLSAYAHNRKRLVSEGQKVKAGERVADMGRDDRNQQLLHFEIRRNGVPKDPLVYLPKR